MMLAALFLNVWNCRLSVSRYSCLAKAPRYCRRHGQCTDTCCPLNAQNILTPSGCDSLYTNGAAPHGVPLSSDGFGRRVQQGGVVVSEHAIHNKSHTVFTSLHWRAKATVASAAPPAARGPSRAATRFAAALLCCWGRDCWVWSCFRLKASTTLWSEGQPLHADCHIVNCTRWRAAHRCAPPSGRSCRPAASPR